VSRRGTSPATSTEPQLPATDLEAVAVEAASEGAQVVWLAAGEFGAVTAKSTATDPVTSLDLASERAIRAVLAARTPGASILGEEGGRTDGSSDLGWVIDPIDGTVNLTYDLPVMSVSVAATVGGRIVAGCVVDVLRGDVFSAARGAGARLDGVAITTSVASELATSLIGTGFAYTPEGRALEATYLARVLPAARDIRCFGSAALNLCWVGCGRLDGFYQRDMQLWDYAAGVLVAGEAGATLLRPDEANGQLMVASAPGIHADLRRLVA
jgi:myo-inositol-1(or 4)-monophosphatase